MLSERISMVSLGHPHVQSLSTRLMTVVFGKALETSHKQRMHKE